MLQKKKKKLVGDSKWLLGSMGQYCINIVNLKATTNH